MAKRYQLPQEVIFPVGKTGDSDVNLCWAASLSSVLWQSGWADDTLVYGTEETTDPSTGAVTTTDLKFSSANDVFNYYKDCFSNKTGYGYFGAAWFFTGEYPVAFAGAENTKWGGGFRKTVNYGDYAFWLPSFNTAQLGAIWPDLSPVSTTATEEDEPAKIPNYGGVIGGLYITNAGSNGSFPSIENAENVVSKHELVVVGYETGGDHSASFNIAEPLPNDMGSFPASTVANPRYVTGFYLIDPDDGLTTTDEEGVETRTEPEPFWVYAKYYPDLRAFRLKPEQTKASWGNSEYFLTDLFFLLKNPNGQGFVNQTEETTQ